MAETYTVNDIYYTIDGSNATVTGCAVQVTDSVINSALQATNPIVTGSYPAPKILILTIPSTVDISGTTYTVRTIGDSAFINRTDLTTIIIPDSVTSIVENAFSGCSSLISVTIGNSVTTIGANAFSCCSSLVTLILPYSVTSIGTNAFSDCSGLTSIIIPNMNTIIPSNAFDGCISLARFYKI